MFPPPKTGVGVLAHIWGASPCPAMLRPYWLEDSVKEEAQAACVGWGAGL